MATCTWLVKLDDMKPLGLLSNPSLEYKTRGLTVHNNYCTHVPEMKCYQCVSIFLSETQHELNGNLGQ